MTKNRTVSFFDGQFQQQIAEGEFALNPFEALALPFLSGRVLDLGCGLGNLTIEAARRNCSVLALDGSASAIARIQQVAAVDALPIQVEEVDLAIYRITEAFDTAVAIGLLMFFPQSRALEMLDDIQTHVCPGGKAIVNVLIEGTTYLEMFDADHYYLFGHGELQERFAGWEILESRHHSYQAPGPSIKAFSTVVARKSESAAFETGPHSRTK